MIALSTAEQDIPPLEAGDRLTRQEFRRRYAASPHIKKAGAPDNFVGDLRRGKTRTPRPL